MSRGKIKTKNKSAAGQSRDRTLDAPTLEKMVSIPGGTFLMGSNNHYPEEAPVHQARVEAFWMDRYLVTNEEFSRFIEETGHVTSAERSPDPKDYPGALPDLLVPASVVFRQPRQRVDLRNQYNWWAYVAADWRHPDGPGSSIRGRENHPVVHVALEDVEAYLKWAGKELPTEAEWEFAARGGLEGAIYAWGNALNPDGNFMANTWQGEFPVENLGTDGFDRTSPVGFFPPNGYGLFDMIGNVWEWTADWYQPHRDLSHSCCASVNGNGEARERSHDPATPGVRIPRRVLKGGSFLCAPNYCQRYRPAARIGHPIDTSTCHIGFRGIVRERPQTEPDAVVTVAEETSRR